MSQINIENLTFGYEDYGYDIFSNVSFILDTDWRLGLIGRNGRGKTTLLKILAGEYSGKGKINGNTNFGYFPIKIKDKNKKAIDVVKEAIAPYKKWEAEMEIYANDKNSVIEYGMILEKYIDSDGYIIDELILKEANIIGIDSELFDHSFDTLSGGEQTKMLIISLFLRKNHFLLLDEPTNHLDVEGRKMVADYLSKKKGFILVSHDVEFVDKAVDHIMSINKTSIDIQKGNFSTWQDNKNRQDNFEIARNTKLKKDIDRLEKTAKEKARWSSRTEATKIGHGVYDRGFVGHKAAKMMKRAKNIENRQNKIIAEKKELLKDIDKVDEICANYISSSNQILLQVKNLEISYEGRQLFRPLSFEVNRGECICIRGKNGTGKTSIIKVLNGANISYSGSISICKKISYISQNSSDLRGDLKEYIKSNNIDEVLFKSNIRKLGIERECFDKLLEHWSEGQKKKVLIAKSITEEAELYIWDEPLNYTDIITRNQIKALLEQQKITVLLVEHDNDFINSVATKIINIEKCDD